MWLLINNFKIHIFQSKCFFFGTFYGYYGVNLALIVNNNKWEHAMIYVMHDFLCQVSMS